MPRLHAGLAAALALGAATFLAPIAAPVAETLGAPFAATFTTARVVSLAPSTLGAQSRPDESGASASANAEPAKRRALSLEDYDKWRRVIGTALSDNGQWMAYAYSPNDGDAILHVAPVSGDSGFTVTAGSNASFNESGTWVAYYINPTQAELDRARRARSGGGNAPGATAPDAPGGSTRAAATPPRRLQARNLATGELFTVPNVNNFAFANGGRWLAVRTNKAQAAAKHNGADLVLRDLTTGVTRNIGNVSQYAFDEDGRHLAYLVDAADRLGNGVYVVTLGTGETRALDGATADYDQLTWSSTGTHLAVLRGDTVKGKTLKTNALLTWTGLGTPRMKAATFDPATETSWPASMVISEFASLRWSPDGTRLWLGVKAQEDAIKRGDDPTPNVDVWHWKDPEPQSVQIVRLNQERRATWPAVLHVADGRVLVVADSAMRTVQPTADMSWGIGRFDQPYRGEVAWGGSRADYYRVNLGTGERTLIAEGLSRTMGTSPDSRWFLYLREGRLYAYDLRAGRNVALDANTTQRFVDLDDDHAYELPTYGVAGWSADARSVVLNHKYDLWRVSLDGSGAENLTRGVGDRDSIRFRVVREGAGPRRGGRGAGASGDEEPLDLNKPLLLSAYGDWTKKSGYWELLPGRAPTPLLYDDRAIGAYTVAKNADRVLFTQGSFVEYPDWYVTDKKFTAPRKVTDANPQITEFAWGSKVLVDYTNGRGQRLQGTLTLPAGYEPGKKYPMLVYFYEKMSQSHHSFSMPTYDDRPHISTYASNGYLVLQPDVVYEIGKPGSSALDCVTSAVKKVIELGYADPERIGLQGHSWGGYQSSFILTQTDMFKAVVTGAPPTNLMSFYGTLYRSSGTIQQGISEVGQVRMGAGATPWTAKELYESQSPVHNVQNITTPFLILHGTEDGAVDWMQGLEYYSAARRMGKEVIMLSYPGEPHHLAKRENQKDFQVRMKQFFDHYLIDAPAPAWMTDGVPQVRKGREVVVPATRAASATSEAPTQR